MARQQKTFQKALIALLCTSNLSCAKPLFSINPSQGRSFETVHQSLATRTPDPANATNFAPSQLRSISNSVGPITWSSRNSITLMVESELKDEAERAIELWAVRKYYQVDYTQIEKQADILIEYNEVAVTKSNINRLGFAANKIFKDHYSKKYIQLAYVALKKIEKFKQEELQAIVTHELGHALGCWGLHSTNKNDLMYDILDGKPTTKDGYVVVSHLQNGMPSNRDLETMHMLNSMKQLLEFEEKPKAFDFNFNIFQQRLEGKQQELNLQHLIFN